jgi:hypothetical protein
LKASFDILEPASYSNAEAQKAKQCDFFFLGASVPPRLCVDPKPTLKKNGPKSQTMTSDTDLAMKKFCADKTTNLR